MKIMGTNDTTKRTKGGGRIEEPASGLLKRSMGGGISEGCPNKSGEFFLFYGLWRGRSVGAWCVAVRCVALCMQSDCVYLIHRVYFERVS